MNKTMLAVAEKQARQWAASKGFVRSTRRERLGFRKSVKAYERRLAALAPELAYREIYQIVCETIKMAEAYVRGPA